MKALALRLARCLTVSGISGKVVLVPPFLDRYFPLYIVWICCDWHLKTTVTKAAA